MVSNAHEIEPIRSLAYQALCRYCHQPVYVAICSDGKWRTFELATFPAAPEHVWAWRKHEGMQEQELIPGKHLHFCAEYSRIHREDLAS